ncbi:hypothetical protein [Luteibacter yeojuensis]|nr:hypothetical protein [Luteibacter yeojuensis]
MKKTSFAFAMCSILGIAALPLAAFADEGDKKSQSAALDNFSIWVGAYRASNDTNLTAHTNVGNSSAGLKFEDDLGFAKKKTVPRARFDFLIGAHQGFSFDYYEINRSRSMDWTAGANVLGTELTANAQAKAKLDFTFGSAAYKWWFGEGDDVFGLGLGAAYYKVHGSLSASGNLNDETASASTSGGTNAWAPNLQLGWRHAFNDQWRMYFNASGVKKNGGDLNGHIIDAALGVEWYPWRNVGVGAEYAYTRISLNKDKRYSNGDKLNLNLDMKLNGPAAYVRFRF